VGGRAPLKNAELSLQKRNLRPKISENLGVPEFQIGAPKTEEDMIVLKATQDKLLSVLQSVSGIVERRHTLPVLANVLIRKTGKALQLTTSDLEIQIRTTAEMDGDAGDFTTTVGARKQPKQIDFEGRQIQIHIANIAR
jgi:hypothetical protein